MKTRFKKKINIFNVAVTAISGMLSVSIGYLMTEIWIRPTITYGLVACFVTETNEK
ncbi:MAG: hypothetical protein IJV20_11910 [Prevotella sp.]|nr:hypothetical protein [Prevotella sp.]